MIAWERFHAVVHISLNVQCCHIRTRKFWFLEILTFTAINLEPSFPFTSKILQSHLPLCLSIAVAIIIFYLPTYLGIYLCKYIQLPRSIIIAVTARLLRA